MRQKHLKGKEMKPVCLLSKAILKGYKSGGCKYSFFAAIVFVMHRVFFSIRAYSARDGT